jgi:thioester reductase-like protein
MRPSITTEGTELEALVAAAAARCLRLPAGIVTPDVPLARLGLDSLGCLELADELESTLGMRVPAEAVVESTTIRSLCATLNGAGPVGAFDRMRGDVELAAEIRPRAFTGAGSLTSARHVLLTGATGFLGSALLDLLMRQTEARVTCLVRAEGEQGTFADRVQYVRADLTSPSAGLASDTWRQLVARTDAVCHAAASINWIAGYDALRDVNVLATRDMLRLAAEAGASFHFVSSASVCYSTALAAGSVDERHDALDAIEGLHFGYAQSKAVGEALVRQAAARGVRTRIYRPAFISGDSRTGRFNPDDMLSRLIAGCVRMGVAPDLDWRLDAVPVDNVAALILALSGDTAPGGGAWHLVHPQPRHWRECVLWMRLYGYNVTLAPYREWTARLRQSVADPDHPLRPLRSFFLEEPSGGLTVPELHEQSRAPSLDARGTAAAIARTGIPVAPLDANLMDRYFTAFVGEGTLPAPLRRPSRHQQPSARHPSVPCPPSDTRQVPCPLPDTRQVPCPLPDTRQVPCPLPDTHHLPTGHSIISELTAWQSGGACGLFTFRAPDGQSHVLKRTAHADDVRAVGEALAGVCGGDRLAGAYREFGGGLGSDRGHEREVALYRDHDPVLRSHTPSVLETRADPKERVWSVLLEDMRGAELLDCVDRPEAWTAAHISAVVDGIAAVHGAWHARAGELRQQPWIGTVRNTATMAAMTPLWRALADHAAPMFAAWTDPALANRQQDLIDRIGEWRPILDSAPQTLIHNDFNPRNVCLRSVDGEWRLCAFDWELATAGTPMRDLAEFLCFVAPPGVQRRWVDELIERHRERFASEARVTADRAAWHASFGAALSELLIDRLSVYAMVHRVKPQAFLPRVVRTWAALHALFPVHGVAI